MRQAVSDRLERLERRRALMINYARDRLDVGDWHGVADAAMDLREVETEMAVLKEMNNE